MLKKFTTTLLALMLLILPVALAACGGGNTVPLPGNTEVLSAFAAYSDIMSRIEMGDGQSGAADMDFVMDMEISVQGQTISMCTGGNIVTIVDGDSIRTAMVMDMDMGFMTTTMEMYMAIEDGAVTMKVLMDGEEMSEMFSQEDFDDILDNAVNMPDLDLDSFRSAEIVEADGKTIIRAVLDGQTLADFVMAAMGDMAELLGDAGDFVMDIDDVPLTIVVDAGDNPLSMEMDMTMHMTVEGESMSMRMEMLYTFNAFGDDVELPVGLG